MTDPERTLAEIHRVLKSDGHFVLTVEVFADAALRDPAHPHAMTLARIEELAEARFKIQLMREAPWSGLRNYVNGLRTAQNQECILLCQRTEGVAKPFRVESDSKGVG